MLRGPSGIGDQTQGYIVSNPLIYHLSPIRVMIFFLIRVCHFLLIKVSYLFLYYYYGSPLSLVPKYKASKCLDST